MENSLLSQKSSDSGLHISLHPLVLLTVSDHITRHAARQQQGPVVGALLGQQNGREITLEHAFECPTTNGPNGEVLLPETWFEERVKQFKDVHKVPPLDIVGWWSTAPSTGPDASHLLLHRQLLQDYNESAVFLAFHPSQLQSETHTAKLPLSVYESVYEGDNATDAAKEMQVDGEEPQLNIRFRELPHAVETAEAEMIGIDTIAKSSGTAANDIPTQEASALKQQKPDTGPTQGAEKKKSVQPELSQEEEELISSLNTRLNAIRTLESRISLIKSYVSSISSAESPSTDTPSNKEGTQSAQLSHPILRNINSLLSHLSILSPQEQGPLSVDILSQSNDVLLVSLLGQLGENVKAMRELGRKSAVVQSARQTGSARKNPGLMQSRFEEELFAQGMGGPGAAAAGMYS